MTSICPQGDYAARIRRVLEYIYNNLDGDLSLDTLADVACMSRFHWHRVFRAMTGETLAEATRRLRLLKAANALVNGDASIAEIAKTSGYPNVTSFSRAFSAAYSMPPGEFRERGAQLANELRQTAGGNTVYPVTIEDLPPCRAAGVLHAGPYPEIGEAFHRLSATLAARNLFAHVRAMIAVYHDAPGSKPEAQLRSHAAVIIGDDFPVGVDGLEYFDLVGGKHAVMAHKGPYATLASAYEWLYGKWLPESGENPRDAPPVEVYVNDPRTTSPDQLRTDIRLPIV